MSYFKLLSIAALSFLLAGCPANTIPDPEPTDTTYGGDAGASTSGTGTDPYGSGEVIDDPFASGEVEYIIYFEFDSSEVRSQAVRQMLMIQGVSASQIATVSFGEERPVAFGSSESDYSQNRRVEFVYP